MARLIAGIVLNVTQVLGFVFILLYYLGDINLNSWMTSPMTAFVFFEGLDSRLISGKKMMGLSFVFVFIESFIAMLLIGVNLIFFDQ